MAKEAALIGALKGAETGYSISEKGLQNLETEIALLKRNQNNILDRLKTAREKLQKLK